MTTAALALFTNPIDTPFAVPVAGCVMILGIVVAGIWSGVRTREMQSQERLAAIAKGIAAPTHTGGNRPDPRPTHSQTAIAPARQRTPRRTGLRWHRPRPDRLLPGAGRYFAGSPRSRRGSRRPYPARHRHRAAARRAHAVQTREMQPPSHQHHQAQAASSRCSHHLVKLVILRQQRRICFQLEAVTKWGAPCR